tara:strand:- start:156 stop:665 length:510 start_codon:yes stop_codon:yes gene_type:complete
MKEVELDLYELQSAAHLGILRCLETLKHKESWGYGYKGTFNDQIADSISGAMGESAVAKFLNIKFTFTCNHGIEADLIFKDLKLQVRTQRPKKNNRNSLILRPTAKQKEIYIYVEDHAPVFRIYGFINSSTILGTTKFLTDFGLKRPKTHSIPIEQLTPIFLLKDGSYN